MTFEQEVFDYIEEINKPGIPHVSTSHYTLRRLTDKYGKDETHTEITRQFRMQKALDFPQMKRNRFVVYSPNHEGLKWPDAERGGAYASMTQSDHHDFHLWTILWEDAAAFDTAEEAENYRSKTVNGHHGRIMTIRQVIEEAFL